MIWQDMVLDFDEGELQRILAHDPTYLDRITANIPDDLRRAAQKHRNDSSAADAVLIDCFNDLEVACFKAVAARDYPDLPLVFSWYYTIDPRNAHCGGFSCEDGFRVYRRMWGPAKVKQRQWASCGPVPEGLFQQQGRGE